LKLREELLVSPGYRGPTEFFSLSMSFARPILTASKSCLDCGCDRLN
jgi:hypothetical protein